MSDIGLQYKAFLEKLYKACKEYVQSFVQEIVEYGSKKSRLSVMLCRDFIRVHLDPLPNQFHIDVALFREFLYWLDKKFRHYYTCDETDELIHETIENAKTEIKEDVLEQIPPTRFVTFTDYLTRAYTIGTQYTTRLLAVENGQPTNNLTIANVVGCTIVSKTYIGNGFDIMFMPTAASFGFRAMLDSDNTVYADYNATATEPIIEVEELTYSDGTKAVTLHAMTLTNTPSVALRIGAGNVTVTTIAYEELDTDNAIVIP